MHRDNNIMLARIGDHFENLVVEKRLPAKGQRKKADFSQFPEDLLEPLEGKQSLRVGGTVRSGNTKRAFQIAYISRIKRHEPRKRCLFQHEEAERCADDEPLTVKTMEARKTGKEKKQYPINDLHQSVRVCPLPLSDMENQQSRLSLAVAALL